MPNLFKISYQVERDGETVSTSTMQDGDVVTSITRERGTDSPLAEFEPIVAVLKDLPKSVTGGSRTPATALGLSTKWGNSLIGVKDEDRPAKYQEAVEAAMGGVVFPVTTREGGRRVGPVAEALFNILTAAGQTDSEGNAPTIEGLTEKLKSYSAEDYATYSQDPGVKAEVARIAAEKAKGGAVAVDTSGLLG